MKKITIVGGGLAGLGLAHGLRLHDVPVTLHEAGRYPRHRVCGEFLSGLDESTLATLGVTEDFADARRHLHGTWFRKGRTFLEFELPRPALALSRHRLDLRLKDRLESAGAQVVEGSRLGRSDSDGHVWAAGRLPRPGPWIGLKAHVTGLSLSTELEMHLGTNGYAGLTPVENDRVNLCALFRLDPERKGRGPSLLLDYLRAGGNGLLAERLEAASIDETSYLGVAGFELGWQEGGESLCAVGDAAGMIPPFTGNGMSMALQSAELALDPLVRWSRSERDWGSTLVRIREETKRKFSRRVAAAMALHRILLDPRGASLAAALSRFGVVPFRAILALVR